MAELPVSDLRRLDAEDLGGLPVETQLLVELTRRLDTAATAQAVVDQAHDVLRAATGSQYLLVARVDGDRLRTERAAGGVPATLTARLRDGIRRGRNTVWRAVTDNRPAFLERDDATAAFGGAVAAAPLRDEHGRARGALVLAAENRRWTTTTRLIIEAAAAIIGGALERTRLLEAATAARREAEALLELSRALEGARTPGEVAARALEAVRRAVPVAWIALWEERDGRAEAAAVYGDVAPSVRDAVKHGIPRGVGAIWDAIGGRAAYVERAAVPGLAAAGVTGAAFLPMPGPRRAALGAYRSGERAEWSAEERRLLEAAARAVGVALERAEAELRFRGVFDQAFQFVALLTPDGDLVDANLTAVNVLGLDEPALAGRPFADAPVWPPADAERVRAAVARAARGELVRFEASMRGPRRTFTVDFSLKALRDPDGRVSYLIAEARDITERRRSERALERQAARLAHLNDELERRTEESEAFVYTASHDLRAPLTTIQGMGALLADAVASGDDDEVSFLIARITENTRRMGQLLADLLALSRAGRDLEDPEPVNLGETVRTAVADLESRLRARDARVEMPGAWPDVLYEKSALYHVVANLVGNAAKFAGRAGHAPVVRVSSDAAPDGTVTLRVEDNGPGVPERHREKIFELFRKLDANAEGTGAGLAIVKRIVEHHGGRVWADDSSLGGARFNVTLPAAVHEDHGGHE